MLRRHPRPASIRAWQVYGGCVKLKRSAVVGSMMRAQHVPLVALGIVVASCTPVMAPQLRQAAVIPAPAAAPQEMCREYTSKGIIDGKPEEMVGTACQQADGRWKLVDGEATPPESGQLTPPPPTVVYPHVYPYPYPYLYPYPYYYYPYPTFFGSTVGIAFSSGSFYSYRH